MNLESLRIRQPISIPGDNEPKTANTEMAKVGNAKPSKPAAEVVDTPIPNPLFSSWFSTLAMNEPDTLARSSSNLPGNGPIHGNGEADSGNEIYYSCDDMDEEPNENRIARG